MNKQSSVDTLKKYIQNSWNWAGKISFFILSGPKDIWKSQYAQDIAKETLWDYFQNDFLYIKDLSVELGKDHNIKVAQKDDETYKTLYKDHNYQDIWTREINRRLQQSPSGKQKILLIENIERMTIAAINAFLKTCEEPLPNRIIIATTANKSQIIDTVLSRSILIPFYKDNFISKYDFKEDLQSISQVLATTWNIHKKHSLLLDINKKWLIQPFLDELIAYYVSVDDMSNSKKRLKIKKMSLTNVNMDNLLFYWLLD